MYFKPLLTFLSKNNTQNIQDHISQLLVNRPKKRKMMTQNTKVESDQLDQDEESSSSEEYDSDSSTDTDDFSDDSPAQAGVIEKLSLKNFMCHDSFELKLGPQINFIIGRNGSGKSAILTGISVGLGAKATDTNRGSSIKDLIKDGKQTSRITIVLKNEGPEAYKPNEYGRKIIVERKLQRVGGNSYSIKNDKGKTISSKKSTLDELLYKFNITVDNPLAFLSQDKAREFLTSATDKTKYGFFMDGAYITEILKNFQVSSTSINELRGKVEQADEFASVCKKNYKDVVKIFNAHKVNDFLRNQLKIINGKIYWYNVKIIKDKLAEFEQQKLQYIQQKDEIKTTINNCENSISKKQPEKEKVENESEEARKQLQLHIEKYSSLKNKIQDLLSNVSMNQEEIKKNEIELKNYQRSIERIKVSIKQEQEKIDAQNGGSRDTLKEKLNKLNSEIIQIELDFEESKVKYRELDPNNDSNYVEQRNLINESRSKLQQLKSEKSQLESEAHNRYAPWGRSMQYLVNQIKSRKDWTVEPIGPLGSYLQVKKEFHDWKPLLNAALGKSLDSFLVTNERDRYQLDQMLRKANVKPNIIVRKNERFNYQSGRPSPDLVSVIDMLDFQQNDVLYTFIDTNQIEKTIIANEIESAQINCRKPNVISALVQFGRNSGKRISYQNGTMRSDPVNFYGPLKFGASSKDDLIQDITKAMNDEQVNLNNLERSQRQIKMKLEQLREDLSIKTKELDRSLRSKKKEMNEIEDQLEEVVDDNSVRKLQIRIDESKIQFERINNINITIQEEIDSKIKELNELKTVQKDAKMLCKKQEKTCQSIKDKLIEIEEDIRVQQDSVKHWMYEETEISKKLEKALNKIQEGTPKLQDALEKASSFCDESSVTITEEDNQDSIAQEYQDINSQLQHAEQALGSSLEEVMEQVKTTKEKMDIAFETLKSLSNTQNQLQDDLNVRLNFLQTTITISVEDASRTFERAMRVRGFKGSLQFNFSDKTLRLIVQTKKDDEKRTVESLSGGEKSFSQIALLLSIWKIMNSKIRGLDEFDVYMDSVNRTISIKLLLNELKQYPKSQNIFITPQDIGTMADLNDKSVKIHRMTNPRND